MDFIEQFVDVNTYLNRNLISWWDYSNRNVPAVIDVAQDFSAVTDIQKTIKDTTQSVTEGITGGTAAVASYYGIIAVLGLYVLHKKGVF